MKDKFWKYITSVLLLFLVFIPKQIMYPEIKHLSWAIFIIIFGVLPYSVYRTIKSLKPNSPLAIIMAFATPLIVGPSFGIYQSNREEKELENHGKWTECVVIHEKYGARRANSWLIKCSYAVDNKTYETNYEKDTLNLYAIGDKLKLIYSPDCPRIYRLESEWNLK